MHFPFRLSAVCLLLFPYHAVSQHRWNNISLYGATQVPELRDLDSVQTVGGWFEATLGGLAISARDATMRSLSVENSSHVRVKLLPEYELFVPARSLTPNSTQTVWVAALWDATTKVFTDLGVDLNASDTTMHAFFFYRFIMGVNGMGLQQCSLDTSDRWRTIYGVSFNTVQGPEARIFSLFMIDTKRELTMFRPTYPGLRAEKLLFSDGMDLISNPLNQCLNVWSSYYSP